MKLLRRVALCVLPVALGSYAGTALAQSYPSQPIRIVVQFAPGGQLDTTARLISPKLANALHQPVVVENHPGAGGRIASNLVAKAAPDGYTILMDAAVLGLMPAVYRNLPFDPVKDFVPVTQLVAVPLVLVANPELPAGSISELIALAKSEPGRLNYGHSGVGDSTHLVMELLKVRTNVDIVGIPYKGAAPTITALTRGEVHVAVIPLGISLPFIKTGRLRALGVTGAQRAAVLPDVPTVAETFPGIEYEIWNGLFMPAGTPRNIINLVQREAVRAINMPDVRDRLRAMGLELVGSTPEAFDAKNKAALAQNVRIMKEARIPPQD